MTPLSEETALDLLEALNETRSELRRLRTGNLVAHLSAAEREEIAYSVFERIDERLAPRENPSPDEPPRRKIGRGRRL